MPTSTTPLDAEIKSNPKLFLYFKDCIGSIDGTHLNAFVPNDNSAPYRDWKRHLSQNVLVACSQALQFIYILSGWEGSIADGPLYHATRAANLHIPQGKYLLADAGFASCDTLLVPYCGVHYHLKEWHTAQIQWGNLLVFIIPAHSLHNRPKNSQELFNLHHAQACNVIEWIFGIVKCCFRLLVAAPRLRWSLHFASFTISSESMIKMIYPLQTSFVTKDTIKQLQTMTRFLCQPVRSQEQKQLEQ